ncbi:MAG TPA: hypothetical protein VMZ69_11965, partial [Saprospiraceae bacterium]|nr:hypothetical protein [Saprospiraceae bacterium]
QVCPGIKNAERIIENVKADLKDEWTAASVNKYLIERGVEVSYLQQKRSSLEEKFLAVLKENESKHPSTVQQ